MRRRPHNTPYKRRSRSRRVAPPLTWHLTGDDDRVFQALADTTAASSATRLSIRHESTSPRAGDRGWAWVLSDLESVLETGENLSG